MDAREGLSDFQRAKSKSVFIIFMKRKSIKTVGCAVNPQKVI